MTIVILSLASKNPAQLCFEKQILQRLGPFRLNHFGRIRPLTTKLLLDLFRSFRGRLKNIWTGLPVRQRGPLNSDCKMSNPQSLEHRAACYAR